MAVSKTLKISYIYLPDKRYVFPGMGLYSLSGGMILTFDWCLHNIVTDVSVKLQSGAIVLLIWFKFNLSMDS